MRSFPFPDQIESREELQRDVLYRKIDPEKYTEISDQAWNTGVAAMTDLLQRYPDSDILEICEKEGLQIKHECKDNVTGGVRFFSEYYSAKKQIVMYDVSVALWAQENGMKLEDAERLLLSHEMFHHLECTKIGMTSDLYKVPWIEIGKLKIGTCGIRALSEIGAHGFSYTYYKSKDLIRTEPSAASTKDVTKLRNLALDEVGLRSSRGMKGFADIPLIGGLMSKNRNKPKRL